jgi:hypothetical protein
MDNRLIALLLIEEWRSRPIWPLPNIVGRKDYLAFLKSIACRSTDRYKGIEGYRLAVREIETR